MKGALFLILGVLSTSLSGCVSDGPSNLHEVPPPYVAPPPVNPPVSGPTYSQAAPTTSPTSAPATNSPEGHGPSASTQDSSRYYSCTTPTDSSSDQSASPPPDPSAYKQLHFAWTYGGKDWTWDPLIPTEVKAVFQQRDRTYNAYNFAVFATDPYEAPFISALVCLLESAGASEGYAPWQMAEFTLHFVQAIPYTTDLASSGYDEYPRFPVETVYDETGDCEDTSILFASLMAGLGYGAVLLQFPHTNPDPDSSNSPGSPHMAVGVLADPSTQGSYYDYHGGRYYYAETTHGAYQYYGIGQMPKMTKGYSANVLPLTPKAVLSNLHFDAPDYQNGAWHFHAEVTNVGSAPVTGLTMMMGFDAGNSRVWSKQVYSQGDTLQAANAFAVDFYLQPPPAGHYTRAQLWAWGTDAPTVEADGEYYQS
ncbi:MAG: hypothetical protein V4510_08695 [bacterium]